MTAPMSRRDWLDSLSPARRDEVLDVLWYRSNEDNREALAAHARRCGRAWLAVRV